MASEMFLASGLNEVAFLTSISISVRNLISTLNRQVNLPFKLKVPLVSYTFYFYI